MRVVNFFLFCFVHSISKIIKAQLDIINVGENIEKTIGECVKFTANQTKANYDDKQIITWTKDLQQLESDARVFATGLQLTLNNIVLSDDAFYQVDVYNPSLDVTESTKFWLGVKSCALHEENAWSGDCKSRCKKECHEGWEYAAGVKKRCYQYIADPHETWDAAFKKCQLKGGELAVIASEAANEHVGAMLRTGEGAWIALNDRFDETGYSWVYRETKAKKLSFSSWGRGEPNNFNSKCNVENCALMQRKTGQWLDIICDDYKPSVCQAPASYNRSDRALWTCTANKCYRYQPAEYTWADARRMCRTWYPLSGDLVEIGDSDENELVRMLLGQVIENAWIGLTDMWEANTYVWNNVKSVTGKAAYLNWSKGEPNDVFTKPFQSKCPGEDCVQIQKYALDVTWHDLHCDVKLPYVCERIRDPLFSNGVTVLVVVVTLFAVSLLIAAIYSAAQRQKQRNAKDIIKKAYQKEQMKEMTKTKRQNDDDGKKKTLKGKMRGTVEKLVASSAIMHPRAERAVRT